MILSGLAQKQSIMCYYNGSIWTAREIIEYLQENYPEKNLAEKKLGTTSLYYWIREKMGMTYRKKRPKNESSSDKDVEFFKKELSNVLDIFEEKNRYETTLVFHG